MAPGHVKSERAEDIWWQAPYLAIPGPPPLSLPTLSLQFHSLGIRKPKISIKNYTPTRTIKDHKRMILVQSPICDNVSMPNHTRNKHRNRMENNNMEMRTNASTAKLWIYLLWTDRYSIQEKEWHQNVTSLGIIILLQMPCTIRCTLKYLWFYCHPIFCDALKDLGTATVCKNQPLLYMWTYTAS